MELDAPLEFEQLQAGDRVVELAIGQRVEFAAALASGGVQVTATDIDHQSVPAPVQFVRDDLMDPDTSVYSGSQLLYARRLPPELHVPAWMLAQAMDAELYFTTLGFESPHIPVSCIPVESTTWYRAHPRRDSTAT